MKKLRDTHKDVDPSIINDKTTPLGLKIIFWLGFIVAFFIGGLVVNVLEIDTSQNATLLEDFIRGAIYTISIIGWCIVYGKIKGATRQKLVDEQKKINFLESEFMYLKGYEFDLATVPENKNYETLLSIFRDKFRKGKITEIYANLPYNEKKPWTVYATVKSGKITYHHRQEQFKDFEIYSILDKELEDLEEYKKLKKPKP